MEESQQPKVADPMVSEVPNSQTPAEEAQVIIDAESGEWPLKVGQHVFLVNARWWDAWTAYTGFTIADDNESVAKVVHLADNDRPARPDAIDNADLLSSELEENTDGSLTSPYGPGLREKLQEGSDYRVVFEGTWRKLHAWYGGGPELQRPVINSGLERTKPVVDVYPLTLKLHYQGKQHTLLMSKEASVADLKAKACQAAGCEEVDVALYDYFNGNKYAQLEGRMDDSLEGVRLFDKQDVLLQRKDEDAGEAGSPPALLGPSTTLTPSYTAGGGFRSSALTDLKDSVTQDQGRRPGMAGLSNLGNTCFMNSSVQCLSHTVPLLRVFLGDAYKNDVNTDNPLGTGGVLAEAFGSLLKRQWQGGVAVVSPRGFKGKLARFAPQFQGYAQQDSQELLAFLLDGLHEDLNRIKNKPYVEEKDADGRPDEEVAAEAWSNYRLRNDSVVVDHFQGLLKSTLVCPGCSHRSVKFDPYMYLSLPLPTSKMRQVAVTVVDVAGAAPPTRYSVQVPKAGIIGDLYTALARVLELPQDQEAASVLLLAELQHCRVGRLLDDTTGRMADVRERTQLLAYHYPDPQAGPRSEGCCQVQVFHRKKRAYSTELFAAPLLLWLPQDQVSGISAEQVAGRASWASEYLVTQPGTALGGAIEAALRPFKRQKVDILEQQHGEEGRGHDDGSSDTAVAPGARGSPFQPAAAPTSCVAGAGASASDDSNKENLDSNTPPGSGAAGRGSASGGAPAAIPSPGGSGGSDASMRDVLRGVSLGEGRAAGTVALPAGMPHCVTDSPEDGFQQLPEQGEAVGVDAIKAEDVGAKGGDEVEGDGMLVEAVTLQGSAGDTTAAEGKDDDGAVSSEQRQQQQQQVELGAAPNAMPAVRPFNMWEAQEQQQQAADAVCSDEPPFQLKRSDQRGETSLVAEPKTDASSTPAACFAIEWAKGEGGEYDLAALEQPEVHSSARRAAEASSRPASVSLDQCLEAFTQPERLDEQDSWYCGNCKQHVQADKKLDVWSAPEVLVVHLKRFSYSRLWRDKLDSAVDFPLQGLDLDKYLQQSKVEGDPAPVYDLYAVSNHYGGLGGGHYTAYCRMPHNGKWYCFDDSHVSEVDGGSVRSPAAYVLFYRRRDKHERDEGVELQARMDCGSPKHVGEQQQQRELPLPLSVPNGAAGGRRIMSSSLPNGQRGGVISTSSSSTSSSSSMEEAAAVPPITTAPMSGVDRSLAHPAAAAQPMEAADADNDADGGPGPPTRTP